MQRSADTTALIFSKGAARPLMPGVGRLVAETKIKGLQAKSRGKSSSV
jgi:hypothetical protein